MYRVSLVSVGPDFRLPTSLQSGCFHIDRDVMNAGEGSPDDSGSGGRMACSREVSDELGDLLQIGQHSPAL